MKALREHNVECVELSLFSENAPGNRITEAVRRVWNAGLRASLHPFLPPSLDGGKLASRYQWLESLLRRMPDFQETIILTVHSLSADRGEAIDYRNRTVEALKRIACAVRKENLPIRFALELNRAKGKIDPCTSFTGVLDICREVGDLTVGICWDWGHAQANILKNASCTNPPAEFLRNVIHTHIHDLGPGGSTHWPLDSGVVPVEKNMEDLKSVGYSGCYVLELNPTKFFQVSPVREVVLASIQRLNEVNLG
ncbi:MAG: TIM barrel protein [Spirochaetaceae bacterium]|nr:MAG: TIM barrel protein [Spirochaetaceae bacterium]